MNAPIGIPHPFLPSKEGAAFWFLGLINNFTFVVFITAAEEIIEGYAGIILLCTVLPGFLSRLVLSFYAERVPYLLRIVLVSVSSTVFILIVALSSSVPIQLLSLILQAAIGALGEISFLALTSKFPDSVVGAWASGTGASGIAGAGTYVFCRDVIGLTSSGTLIACSVFPLLMIVIYQGVLVNSASFESLPSDEKPEDERLSTEVVSKQEFFRTLLLTYMLPLAVVYFAEYTINEGVLGTLTKFKNNNEYGVGKIYAQLQFTYQVAVFIARSSIYIVKVHTLWVMPILQLLNLVVLAVGSMFVLFPSAVTAFLIVFWEGLLGGLTYVNAFYRIKKETPPHLKEWAMGTATVGDAAGISVAAVVSIWLESAIVNFQHST